MANLTPVPNYDPIPQLEKTDRIEGGAGGTSNEQAQALINNIEMLKQDCQSTYVPKSWRGSANGVASLDSSGKVPQSQIPTQGSLRGEWNANTNTPTITQGSAVVGGETVGNSDYFMVSVGGTQMGITFSVGDRVVWDGTAWFKLAGSAVSSVNGLQGAVILPITQVASGSPTITPNYDQRIIASGSGTITLGSPTTDGITVDILFLSNKSIKHRAINGSDETETIQANRMIRFVWTGSAWFAVSEHCIGEIIQQIGHPTNPQLLFGGGWERVYYGGLYLRENGGYPLTNKEYTITWTDIKSAQLVSGSFDSRLWNSAVSLDMWVAMSNNRLSGIRDMTPNTITFENDMWEGTNPGTSTLYIGLREALPAVWGTYGASELTEKSRRVVRSGAFFDAGQNTSERWNSNGDDDGSPGLIGFQARLLNHVWGRGLMAPGDYSIGGGQVAVRPNSMDVYFWKRIY